jgi:hypothetical protein
MDFCERFDQARRVVTRTHQELMFKPQRRGRRVTRHRQFE